METTTLITRPPKVERVKLFIEEDPDLSEMVLFGDELIELDESMFGPSGESGFGLCKECEKLGYCKMKGI